MLDELKKPTVKSALKDNDVAVPVVAYVHVPVTVSAPVITTAPLVLRFKAAIVLLFPTIVQAVCIVAVKLVYVPPANVKFCKFNVVAEAVVAPEIVLVLLVQSRFLNQLADVISASPAPVVSDRFTAVATAPPRL